MPLSFQRKNIPLGSIHYLFSERTTLLHFGDKKSKSVVLLSTLHNNKSEIDGKPEIVTYYNKTKCGVDLADQVIRNYSCKRKSRRWPLTLFYNCLDISAYNAYLLYCLKYPEFKEEFKSHSRREFLYKLSVNLMSPDIDPPKKIFKTCFNQERKRCHICPTNPGIKTNSICKICQKMFAISTASFFVVNVTFNINKLIRIIL